MPITACIKISQGIVKLSKSNEYNGDLTTYAKFGSVAYLLSIVINYKAVFDLRS